MNGIRRSETTAKPRRNGARLAFVFSAMLAVFLQAFAVQTHVHAVAAPVAVATIEQSANADHGVHVTLADHQSVCLICQALAANGSATFTDAAQITAHTASSNETAALEIRLAPRALTHSWQSRAPPIAA